MWRGKVDAGNSWDASMVVSTRLIMTSLRDHGIFRPREPYFRLRKKNYTQQECSRMRTPVQTGLCKGGLCPGGLCPVGLFPGGSLSREVSVQGGLCQGDPPADRQTASNFICMR